MTLPPGDEFQLGAFLLGDGVEAITTGDANPRMVIDAAGITAYDGAGNILFRLDASTGAITVTGIIHALNGSSYPAAGVTGQLTDAQLAEISAAKIAGQLTDAQLAEIAAAKIVGQLVDNQLAGISAVKIAGQLTNAQIAEIAAAKVTGELIAAQIAAGAILSTKIADGAVTTPKVAAGAITANEIAANTITAAKIAADTITAGQIAANAITGSEIAANAVTAAKIAADTITAGQIAANAITSSEIAANAVIAGKIAADAVTAATIAADAVTATKISAGAVETAKLAAGAVTTGKLAAGAVTATEIAAGAITAAKIAAGAIDAMTITGATIQTSAANPKVKMDATGLHVIDATGVTVAEITAPGGALDVLAGSVDDPLDTDTERRVRWVESDDGLVAEILANRVIRPLPLAMNNAELVTRVEAREADDADSEAAASYYMRAERLDLSGVAERLAYLTLTTGGSHSKISVTANHELGSAGGRTIIDSLKRSHFAQWLTDRSVALQYGEVSTAQTAGDKFHTINLPTAWGTHLIFLAMPQAISNFAQLTMRGCYVGSASQGVCVYNLSGAQTVLVRWLSIGVLA